MAALMAMRYREKNMLLYRFLIILMCSGLIAITPTQTQAGEKWYTGGTLHKATALQWQQATYTNKLATCSDFFAFMYKNKKLKPSIQAKLKTIDDFKPYATDLVNGLDNAFKPDPDPTKNKQLFTNQTVSEAAVLIMAMSGWIE